MMTHMLRSICATMLTTMLVFLVGCPETPPPPTGNATEGAVLFAIGDGVSTKACANCHGEMAEGGGQTNAPNIQGESYAEVDRKIRGSANHVGGKFDFTTQEVADIVAYLASLK